MHTPTYMHTSQHAWRIATLCLIHLCHARAVLQYLARFSLNALSLSLSCTQTPHHAPAFNPNVRCACSPSSLTLSDADSWPQDTCTTRAELFCRCKRAMARRRQPCCCNATRLSCHTVLACPNGRPGGSHMCQCATCAQCGPHGAACVPPGDSHMCPMWSVAGHPGMKPCPTVLACCG